MKRVLVVANETLAGKPLIDAVKRRGEGDEVRAHVISPQNQPKHGYVIYDEHVRDAAQNRLDMTLALLREAGIEADGQVMDPDPYSAGLDAQRPDRAGAGSHGQARGTRRERAGLMEAAAHAEHHHGPPPANVSSRVEAQFLGMLLFIISEVMLFGAFFTAYFFIRVVAESGWFPINGGGP